MQMSEAEKKLYELYKKRTGKELTLGEIQEATRNMVRFVELLADWEVENSPDSEQEKR